MATMSSDSEPMAIPETDFVRRFCETQVSRAARRRARLHRLLSASGEVPGRADENPLTGLHRRFEVIPGAQAQAQADWGRRAGSARSRRHLCRLFVPHDVVAFARPVHLLHHQHGPGELLGLSPAGVRALRRCPRDDRSGVASRCIPRQPGSTSTTGSPSTCLPLTAPPARAASSGRSTSRATTSSPAGPSTPSPELDGALEAWLPTRRGQVHRTHGEVISVRAGAEPSASRRPASSIFLSLYLGSLAAWLSSSTVKFRPVPIWLQLGGRGVDLAAADEATPGAAGLASRPTVQGGSRHDGVNLRC